MKTLITALVALTTVLSAQAFAQPVNCFTIPGDACHEVGPNAVPKTVDEFKALRTRLNQNAKTELDKAYAGATLFLHALMARSQDQAVGDQMVVMALDKGELTKGATYKGFTWGRGPGYHLDRLATRPHVARAHAKGSAPKDGYQVDLSKPVTVVFRQQSKYVPKLETGQYKVFACTSGAATCRPIALKRNTKGLWKVASFSSISVDIQKVAPADDGDDL